MRILVTNDDGIDAVGLEAMRHIAHSLTDDVWVVAPQSNQSGVSHSLTLKVPLRLEQRAEKVFALSGTPTDCVLMGVLELMKDKKPDLVLSGVNNDQNAADDVTYSGTIAAAIEGTLLGVPSVAMSQCRLNDERVLDWNVSKDHGAGIVKKLIKADWSDEVFYNINFPACLSADVQGTKITRQGQRNPNLLLRYDKRVDMQDDPYFWLYYRRDRGNPPTDTDLGAVRDHYISVSPLQLDLTHEKRVKDLQQLF